MEDKNLNLVIEELQTTVEFLQAKNKILDNLLKFYVESCTDIQARHDIILNKFNAFVQSMPKEDILPAEVSEEIESSAE